MKSMRSLNLFLVDIIILAVNLLKASLAGRKNLPGSSPVKAGLVAASLASVSRVRADSFPAVPDRLLDLEVNRLDSLVNIKSKVNNLNILDNRVILDQPSLLENTTEVIPFSPVEIFTNHILPELYRNGTFSVWSGLFMLQSGALILSMFKPSDTSSHVSPISTPVHSKRLLYSIMGPTLCVIYGVLGAFINYFTAQINF